MKYKRKPLASPRKKAYIAQSGRCFYCNKPMWLKNPEQFAAEYRLSARQAQLLKCTGEHLTAHYDRGTTSASNIVAACWYCNSRRYRAAEPLAPHHYHSYVRCQISRGRWHPFKIPDTSALNCDA